MVYTAAMRLPPMRLALTASIIALTTLACQPDRNPSATTNTITRDSAGVRVIENPRPPAGSRLGWRVADEPSLTIGATDGDPPYLLHRVQDAMRLADGRIVVANGGSNELRVFDASGTHTATWSREGEGPGEFTSLGGVDPWPGDSLVAWNTHHPGIAIFDLHGKHGRSFSLADSDPHSFAAPLLGGTMLAHREVIASSSGSADDGLIRYGEHFQVRDGEGRFAASLGTYPGREIYSSTIAGTRVMMEIPFMRRVAAAAWGGLAVIAPGHSYEIRAYARDGTLRRIVRRNHTLIPTTPAHRDAHLLGLMRGGRGRTRDPAEEQQALRQARESFGDLPLPETLPAFATLMIDALDHLWVEEFRILDGTFEIPGQEHSEGPLWTVFDPAGQVLGFVETPLGLEIYEIGADYLLGHTTDEDGVEYVQLWPLKRTGPGGQVAAITMGQAGHQTNWAAPHPTRGYQR